MNKNIAAVTILYNPEKDFYNNILSYANHVSLLILIDNSENPDLDLHKKLQEINHVIIIPYHENKGISKALNDAVELAESKGFDWIMTMDQDSSFEKLMIEKYVEQFSLLPNKEMIAAVGPVSESKNNPDTGEKTINVTSLITSGSLVNIGITKKIGGFNEKLFIDEVDHEFCYRAILQGYSILQFPEIFLQHKLGELTSIPLPFGRKTNPRSLHSPLRLYYMVRNSCYMISTFKTAFPEEMKRKKTDVLVKIKNSLLFEKNKLKVIKYVAKGLCHFFTGRFGKY
jgi:rhamnosyltransferase